MDGGVTIRAGAAAGEASLVHSAAPTITAAVCTYDRYDHLDGVVDSLRAQTGIAGSRIMVVDNSPGAAGSTGAVGRHARAADLTYLTEPVAGLARARNRALEACTTEFIAFIDDDARAEPGWLAALLHAFEAGGPETVVAGGPVRPEWQAPRPPWLHKDLLSWLSLVDWGGGPEPRPLKAGEWLAGANIAYRTEAARRHGRFAEHLGRIGDGRTLLGNEETGLTARLLAAGGRSIYAPSAAVRHLIPAERLQPSWFRRRAAWQAVSDFMMDPDAAAASADRLRAEARAYVDSLPLDRRPPLEAPPATDDPQAFRAQIRTAYASAALMLTGLGT